MSSEYSVGTKTYLFDKMDLFKAGDVARIWSYALIMLAKAPLDLKAEDFAKSFPTFISMVPKPENDYAMNLCLGNVKRNMGNDKGWSPLTSSTGSLMYEDMSLAELYQIIFYALKSNELLHFFGAPLAPLAMAGGGS